MKKVFTTLFAALGMTMAMNAETVDDLKPMMHSYACTLNTYTGNGTIARVKGTVFGGGYFLDVTGGSIATNKGSIDIADPTTYPSCYGGAEADTARLAAKYTKYGASLNSLRLKNAQDVIAFKPTAGSVVYVFGQGNNKTGSSARIPKFATDAALTDALNEAPTDDYPASSTYCYKFTVPAQFDGTVPLYVGSYNGDAFFSFIIVEANEPAGTPSVEVNPTAYDEASQLYYQEVVCTPNNYVIDGVDLGETTVYYTTDGTEPTNASAVYTEPIKCYKDMSVKFQAYSMFGICDGASNEASVAFTFNAPTLTVDGANATIATEYKNATNYYTINGGEAVAGDSYTATASCVFAAYTVIKNGEYAEWTTGAASSPIYVLDPIKANTVITVSGTVVEDEEGTAASTTGETVWMVENGKVLVNGAETYTTVFANSPAFKVVKDEQYQVPAGQEVYLQMGGDYITFLVADGDSVDVTVTCSKNACKSIADENTYKDDGVTIDKNNRGCMVNVDGNLYGWDDITIEGNNIIKFGLSSGLHTFKKWNNTGNILVSSIEITPIPTESIEAVKVAPALNPNAPVYDLTGRRVAAPVKGIYLQNGKKFIVK